MIGVSNTAYLYCNVPQKYFLSGRAIIIFSYLWTVILTASDIINLYSIALDKGTWRHRTWLESAPSRYLNERFQLASVRSYGVYLRGYAARVFTISTINSVSKLYLKTTCRILQINRPGAANEYTNSGNPAISSYSQHKGDVLISSLRAEYIRQ